jgi:hypothetical protein
MLSPLDASLSASMSSSLGLTVITEIVTGASSAAVVSCTGVKYGLISVAVKSKAGGASRREEVSWNVMPLDFSFASAFVARGTVRTPSAVLLRFFLWQDGAEEARPRALTASFASVKSESTAGETGAEG